jgi:hypothetical protein
VCSIGVASRSRWSAAICSGNSARSCAQASRSRKGHSAGRAAAPRAVAAPTPASSPRRGPGSAIHPGVRPIRHAPGSRRTWSRFRPAQIRGTFLHGVCAPRAPRVNASTSGAPAARMRGARGDFLCAWCAFLPRKNAPPTRPCPTRRSAGSSPATSPGEGR